MRVLVVADGSRGDVQPMRVLAAALANEGHSVVFAGPPGMRTFIEAEGLRFVPLRVDTETLLRESSQAVVSGPLAVARAARQLLNAVLISQFEVLPELARNADFILAGGVHTGVPSVAELCGVPWRWVLFTVNSLPSLAHPPFLVPFGRAPRIVNWLAWHFAAWGVQRMLGKTLQAQRQRLGLPAVPEVADHYVCEHPILAMEPELAPLPPEYADVDVVGYLDPGAGAPLPDELEAFLAAGPPPLYIGFGSMTDPDPDATTRIFVETARRCGVRLVLSRGWAGFGRELPENCIAVGPLSHSRLFARVAATVHHGGSGTTAASARAGVPQLIVPHLADQYYFGRRVQDIGVGPSALRRTRLTVSALCSRVQRMLQDSAMRERARQLGMTIRARPPLHDVSRLLKVPGMPSLPAPGRLKRISIQPPA